VELIRFANALRCHLVPTVLRTRAANISFHYVRLFLRLVVETLVPVCVMTKRETVPAKRVAFKIYFKIKRSRSQQAVFNATVVENVFGFLIYRKPKGIINDKK
jgi:hypothetical protein